MPTSTADALSLWIAFPCVALGLVLLAVLGYVSERHGPALTYEEQS